MEGAIKHTAWAAAVVACCYFATSRNWSPITLQITASPSGQAPVGGALAVAARAPAPSDPATFPDPPAPRSLPTPPTLPAPADLARAGAPSPSAVITPAPAATSTNFATIEDAKVARQVLETLGKLEGVEDVPAGTPPGQIATIFFDPRCPYCHAAFEALHGRVAARWVPVVVLGEPEAGSKLAQAILAAPDRVGALKQTFASKAAAGGEGGPAQASALAVNREAFASIFAAAPNLRPGVPTMFVPRPDGRLAIMIGYEAGDEAKMRSVLTGS